MIIVSWTVLTKSQRGVRISRGCEIYLLKIDQRGVQWKQGVVVYIIL